MSLTVMICANQAWNLVNFRSGLIAELIRQGFDVVAMAPRDSVMEARLEAMGCRFVPVEIDAMGLNPRRDIATIRAIYREMRRIRPEAWLSWTIKPNVYGLLAARLCGVKAFPNVSGLGTAFISRSPLIWVAKLLYWMSFAGAARVFFQNTDDADVFAKAGLVRTDRITILPGSGIDLEHFQARLDERPIRRQFLLVARIVGDKGVREYVAAARHLRRKWPDIVCRLMGPVDVANRTSVPREEILKWQREGVIELIEPCDDVRPAIEAADFVVLPSYREGLSRVLLEASAIGRPIVTTNVPGCRDVVRDGENGYLCEARDADSLATAMERACTTEDAKWFAMARAGRARASAEFSVDRVNRIYLDAMADAGATSPRRA